MTAVKAGPIHGWRLQDGIYRENYLAGRHRLPRHGVTARELGNMKEPQRRAHALAAAGLEKHLPRFLRQVHGTTVLEAKAEDASVPEADGWISRDPRVALCIYVADCVPIFLWDRQGSAAGVFHAGWRGLASGMARTAVRAFGLYGLGPERLAAAVGPHVGSCCYEVGLEVARKFDPQAVSEKAAGSDRFMLDLGVEARLQLLAEGVAAEAVSLSGDCTACQPDNFFSYRREKADKRMMAFITAAGEA